MNTHLIHDIMREWLSGGVSPCQGEGRGFESRLALSITKTDIQNGYPFFVIRVQSWTRSSNVSAPLRSAQNRGPPDLVRRLALNMKRGCRTKICGALFT